MAATGLRETSNLSPSLYGDVDELSAIGAALSPTRSRLSDSTTGLGLSTSASAAAGAPRPGTSTTAAASVVADGSSDGESILGAFFREVQAAPPAFQRLHLRSFLQRLDDFLSLVGPDESLVSPIEWEGLVLHLLALMHRRGGLTPLQVTIHDEISDTAFAILHRMVTTLHPSLPRVRAAFEVPMTSVDLTLESIVDPCADGDIPELPVGFDVDPDVEMAKEIKRLEEEAVVEAEAEDAELSNPSDAMSQQQLAEFQVNPYWFTIDCLPTATAGLLTEDEFQRVEAWFAALEQVTGGRYAVTAGITAAGNVLACRWMPDKALREWARLFPDGTATLADVLRFLFPTTPAWVIQMRIEGAALVGDRAGVAIPKLPQELWRKPPAEAAMDALEVLAATIAGPSGQGALPSAVDASSHLRMIFDVADFNRTGTITIHSLRAALGERLAAGPIDLAGALAAAQQQRTARDGAVALDFRQFVCAVLRLPAELSAAATMAINEASRVARWAAEERLAVATKNEVPYFEPKKQPKRLLVNHRVLLRERSGALREELAARHGVMMRRAVRVFRMQRAIDEQHELKRRRDEADRIMDAKNIPVVSGPLPAPAQYEHGCGLQYNGRLFDLSAFVADDKFRVDTIRWLEAMDQLGIHPQLFLGGANTGRSRPSALLAKHFLRDVLCQPQAVHRDAAIASKRPSGKTFWTGHHALQVKTNIAVQSDTKFGLVLEGYNPGSGTPIFVTTVGFASSSLPTVGTMERYGWPDGWDTLATVRHCPGVTVEQYASTDGFVCLELKAKSLSQVGLAVSCSQVCPSFEGPQPFAATVYHSLRRC